MKFNEVTINTIKDEKSAAKFHYYSAPHCKCWTSYGNSVCPSLHPSVRPSHADIVSKWWHI